MAKIFGCYAKMLLLCTRFVAHPVKLLKKMRLAVI